MVTEPKERDNCQHGQYGRHYDRFNQSKIWKVLKWLQWWHLDRIRWGHSWLLCLETWSCPIDQVGSANPFLTVCIKKQSPGPWIKAFTTQVVWVAKSKCIIVSEAMFVCFEPMLLCFVQYWISARTFKQSVQYHNRISEVFLDCLIRCWGEGALPFLGGHRNCVRSWRSDGGWSWAQGGHQQYCQCRRYNPTPKITLFVGWLVVWLVGWLVGHKISAASYTHAA